MSFASFCFARCPPAVSSLLTGLFEGLLGEFLGGEKSFSLEVAADSSDDL